MKTSMSPAVFFSTAPPQVPHALSADLDTPLLGYRTVLGSPGYFWDSKEHGIVLPIEAARHLRPFATISTRKSDKGATAVVSFVPVDGAGSYETEPVPIDGSGNVQAIDLESKRMEQLAGKYVWMNHTVTLNGESAGSEEQKVLITPEVVPSGGQVEGVIDDKFDTSGHPDGTNVRLHPVQNLFNFNQIFMVWIVRLHDTDVYRHTQSISVTDTTAPFNFLIPRNAYAGYKGCECTVALWIGLGALADPNLQLQAWATQFTLV